MADHHPHLAEKVAAIPGEDGFWKSRAAHAYQRAAEDLIAHGFTETAALRMLTELYWTAAECFGGG